MRATTPAGTGDGSIRITAHGISGLPSTFVLSDFDDVCELGRGTCSIVRRVRHRASNTDLALKPISIGDKEHRWCSNPFRSFCARCGRPVIAVFRAQLRAEIAALAGNSHPNILQLYNAFFDERNGLVCAFPQLIVIFVCLTMHQLLRLRADGLG